jgi:chorismate mutase
MPKTIDHDQLFKQLIGTFFLEFLDLFVPELADKIDRDNLEFLPQEYFTDIIEGDRRAMDLVVRVNLRRRPNEPEVGKVWAIIDCEHQSSSEANFQRRIFFYFAQLHREYLEPVYPIAKIEKKDRAKVKVECLRAIATLKLDPARVSILSGFVDTYLNLNQSEEVEFEREVASIKKEREKERVMQIVTSWMEQGIEQGVQTATLKSVLRVLTRRVGELDAGVNKRLQQLSVSQLEDLLDAALDFTQIADLESWLSQI